MEVALFRSSTDLISDYYEDPKFHLYGRTKGFIAWEMAIKRKLMYHFRNNLQKSDRRRHGPVNNTFWI